MVHDYPTASDDRLVALGLTGDRAAWGELVERHKDGLVNYLTRMTGERGAAEDLAHDAFVRLFERAASYRPQGRFRAYLYRIAVNLLRSQERRKQRWRLIATRFLPVNGERPEPATSATARWPRRWHDCRSASAPRSCCSTSRAGPIGRSPMPWVAARAR